MKSCGRVRGCCSLGVVTLREAIEAQGGRMSKHTGERNTVP